MKDFMLRCELLQKLAELHPEKFVLPEQVRPSEDAASASSSAETTPSPRRHKKPHSRTDDIALQMRNHLCATDEGARGERATERARA